jgi:protein-S-isoprenylcysteine O-methyltransferase Ste14
MRHVVYDVTRVGTWCCWIAFVVVWTVGAAVARQTGPADRRRRDLASTIAGFVAFGIVVSPRSWWRPLTIGAPGLRLVGLVLLVVATAGAIWARVALGAMWASSARISAHHVLRTGGPYRITRHPIYTAILGMVAATVLTQGLGRWAPLFVVILFLVFVKVRDEERLLVEQFPIEYERYRSRVPQLIPRLHR